MQGATNVDVSGHDTDMKLAQSLRLELGQATHDKTSEQRSDAASFRQSRCQRLKLRADCKSL